MADPICRWRNPYVNTIVELVDALPHEEMSSDDFRTIIEERWPGFLHTPYQLACQVGLYYESEDGMYHPRFDHDVDENEARLYMERWIARYYVPNPYTKSMKTLQQPQPFLASIIRYVYEHPDETELHSILEAVFQEKIGNIDIISNVLNTYTDFIKVDTLGNVELTVKAYDFMKQYIDRNDKKAFFENFATPVHAPKLIIEQKVLASFILSIVKYFYAIDELNAIVPYTSSSSPIKVSKDGVFSLVGMFLESTIDDVKERNKEHARWFEDVFTLGERSVYLSTQWNSQGDYQLTLDDFIKMIKTCYGDNYIYKIGPNKEHQLWSTDIVTKAYFSNKDKFLPYLTAFRTKPFMLLAGISGTGKSRIVRELAKACWKEGDEEYGKNCPKNFCMVQVKPNWHDSTELFGYVSRISGKPEFVAGDFMKFVIKAWENPDVPYFLCLDEMNLAPVEQYFAEYLSVIESRKSDGGIISTDAIFKKPFENKEYDDAIDYEEGMDWYQKFIIDNTSKRELRQQFYKNGITIPNNLFVIGTVNMDETTFSFSRKVLDRAMTLEMNEVDLYGGLEENGSEIGYIGNCIIGNAAEGKDIYADNKELCDKVISYLEKVNAILDKTPFKVAYRTRNEFILYAVNRQLLDDKSQLWQTLDEMTSMKILSRIEGDSDRTQKVLEGLKALVGNEIVTNIPEAGGDNEKAKSITAAKIEEMLKKLKESGYTSYWT